MAAEDAGTPPCAYLLCSLQEADGSAQGAQKLRSTEIKLSEMHLKGKAHTCHKEWTLETEDKTFLR